MPYPEKKNQPDLEGQVIALIQSQPGHVFSEEEIINAFKLRTRGQLQDMADVLEDLIFSDKITFIDGPRGGFTFAQGTKTAQGKVDFASNRRAFVVVEEEEQDIAVNPSQTNSAQHGDIVEVQYVPTQNGSQPEGKITSVISRARTEVTGIFRINGGRPMVEPDVKRMHQDVMLEGDLQGARKGDKVLVTITEWAPINKPLRGRVMQVLGQSGSNEAEMQGILAEFGLPLSYPEDAERDAELIPAEIPVSEIANRHDFRNVTTFTIDPVDAKDFDDALSIRSVGEGLWEVGVHIADVTYYVHEGTALEAEARRRATSIYLVDRVIPMLPERLSNFLCSLRPHEDKLTYSAVFVLDEKGKIHREWFGRTIIHSDHRFAYEDAQKIIEGNEGPFREDILTLNKLAFALRKDRFKKGAISFETPEVRFKLDETGKPIGIVAKVRQEAHMLIEDFMLLANKQVAEYVYNLKPGKQKLPMVYRVHEDPDPDKLVDLQQFVTRFGHQLNFETKGVSKELNRLSSEIEGKPEATVINQYAVRSMQKAKYTTEPLGHFGLGYKHYSHFTSPIRRYPDMMAHRMLTRYLAGEGPADARELEVLCRQSSEMEKRAADAERASIKYKQVEFMLERLGEEFDGVISGVTEWGMYVEIPETVSEGMIRLTDIPGDHYVYEASRNRVEGKRRGKIFYFGDKVRVRVANGNLMKRTLDFELIVEGVSKADWNQVRSRTRQASGRADFRQDGAAGRGQPGRRSNSGGGGNSGGSGRSGRSSSGGGGGASSSPRSGGGGGGASSAQRSSGGSRSSSGESGGSGRKGGGPPRSGGGDKRKGRR